jgi:hypothetical protein
VPGTQFDNQALNAAYEKTGISRCPFFISHRKLPAYEVLALHVIIPPPQALGIRALALGFQPACFGGLGWPSRLSINRRHSSRPDHLEQSFLRVLPVLQLGPETICGNDDDAIIAQAAPCEHLHPGLHAIRQCRIFGEAEPQLHGSRNLIDVLPPRAGRRDKTLFELGIVDP